MCSCVDPHSAHFWSESGIRNRVRQPLKVPFPGGGRILKVNIVQLTWQRSKCGDFLAMSYIPPLPSWLPCHAPPPTVGDDNSIKSCTLSLCVNLSVEHVVRSHFYCRHCLSLSPSLFRLASLPCPHREAYTLLNHALGTKSASIKLYLNIQEPLLYLPLKFYFK